MPVGRPLPQPQRPRCRPENWPPSMRCSSCHHSDHGDLIDMTAMVDIVFFLLIFFLVTSMRRSNR